MKISLLFEGKCKTRYGYIQEKSEIWGEGWVREKDGVWESGKM